MSSKCWVIHHVQMPHFIAQQKLSQSLYTSDSENLPLLLTDGDQIEMNDWVYFSYLPDIIPITRVSNFLLIEVHDNCATRWIYFGQILGYNKPANLNYVN